MQNGNITLYLHQATNMATREGANLLLRMGLYMIQLCIYTFYVQLYPFSESVSQWVKVFSFRIHRACKLVTCYLLLVTCYLRACYLFNPMVLLWHRVMYSVGVIYAVDELI